MADRSVTVRLRADISNFQRGLATAATETSAFTKRLEAADSRMAALVQTGLALAPALVPIGAAAVPAIAGLTTQLGFAGAAAGTTLLAFQGVGDALTALNKFQLKPTGENLQKLNEKLDALGPAGEVFVRRLQELRGELQVLQDVAQQNMMPGLSEGIDSALTQLPRFEGVIAAISTALGDLGEDLGSALASPEGSDFLEYLEREAGPILESTGKALGNLVVGITNMVMAFDPLSDSFVSGMQEMSEAFVSWSDGLDSSQGFQEFVRYVQESGPQAMETLGAIASALIEFVEAAAPVGAVVLPVLEVLADALSSVADSPAGPVIVGAAAAVGALGRSLALLSAVGLRGGAGDTLLGKIFAVDKIKAGAAALTTVTSATDRARLSTAALAKVEAERSATARAGVAQIGKNAAALGGLALMTTGLADGMGVSNTMSMALMGTLAGPWGAAVGGGVGLLMDFASAGDLADDMQTKLSASVRTAGLDFTAMKMAVDAGSESLANYWEQQSLLGELFEAGDWALTGESAFDTITAKQKAAEEQARSLRDAFANVAMAMGEDFTDSAGRSMLPTLDQLTLAADRAQPAMRALGITAEDLADMDATELRDASEAIAEWTVHADSADGRTQAVAEAFRQLDNDMVDTATSADTLKDTLEALLGPGMNLSAATDAWRDGLRNLNKELDRNNGSLFDNTDAASQNRSVIRGMVTTSVDLLTAQANAGTSARKLSQNLKGQRDALLDAGAAAGISRGEMNKYLTTLGLTPKMIKTLVKAETAEAMANINGFKFAWDSLKSKTIYLTTVTTRAGAGGQGNGYGPSAYGNVFPSVASFAYGDVANGHQAELAGPGAIRMWREPETQGEAYIPLANDGRRPRARSILEDTASILGARSIEWFAGGGTSGDKKPKKHNLGPGEEPESVTRAREKREEEAARRQEQRDAKAEFRAEAAERDRERLQKEQEDANDFMRQVLEEQAERQREHDAAVLEGQQRAWDQMTDAAKAQVDAAKDQLDAVKASMDQLGAAATSAFRSAWFEPQSQQRGLWMGANQNGVGDWRSKANQDIAGLQERAQLLTRLSDPSLGLSGAALQELLGSQDNTGIAAMLAAGEVDDFAALFAQRETLLAGVSQQAGMAGYGSEWTAANTQFTAMNEHLARLTALIEAQRPITVLEAVSAAATAAEIARLQGNY